ncbi:hypothetical protein IJT93_08540 [bacterium]|nr:hypothetical protein [bacterium]
MLSSEYNQTLKHTPVSAVLKRILKECGEPITVKELTTKLMDEWGRDFPYNPYEEYCLVYKLAVGVLKCEESYENLANGAPLYIEREQPNSDHMLVSGLMGCDTLNAVVDNIAEIKLIYKGN